MIVWKGGATVAVIDGGDDLVSVRRRKVPSGLRDVKCLRDIQNEHIEEHEREPKRAKVTESEPHHDLEKREEKHWSLVALALTKKRLPPKKWQCFLAVEFGMVEDAKGILRVHRALLARPEEDERALTFDEVAQWYSVSADTVKQYDGEARRAYQRAREEVLAQEKRSHWWGDEYGPLGASALSFVKTVAKG